MCSRVGTSRTRACAGVGGAAARIVRTADTVLTPSESAKADAIGLLGVPEKRVAVIGSGTAPAFGGPSPADGLREARKGVKGLEEDFIVYNGAFNPRKGVDNLLEGYASLPADVVRRHQLVIVCEAPPLTRNHYLVMAKKLGLDERLWSPASCLRMSSSACTSPPSSRLPVPV